MSSEKIDVKKIWENAISNRKFREDAGKFEIEGNQINIWKKFQLDGFAASFTFELEKKGHGLVYHPWEGKTNKNGRFEYEHKYYKSFAQWFKEFDNKYLEIVDHDLYMDELNKKSAKKERKNLYTVTVDEGRNFLGSLVDKAFDLMDLSDAEHKSFWFFGNFQKDYLTSELQLNGISVKVQFRLFDEFGERDDDPISRFDGIAFTFWANRDERKYDKWKGEMVADKYYPAEKELADKLNKLVDMKTFKFNRVFRKKTVQEGLIRAVAGNIKEHEDYSEDY